MAMSLIVPSASVPLAKQRPPISGVMSTRGIHIVRHRCPSSGQYIASWCQGVQPPPGSL